MTDQTTETRVVQLEKEIKRLRAQNAELMADLALAAAWVRDTFPDRDATKETTNV